MVLITCNLLYENWPLVQKTFIDQFFLQSLTVAYQVMMSQFTLKTNENFRKVWEWFKELTVACPHYGQDSIYLVKLFTWVDMQQLIRRRPRRPRIKKEVHLYTEEKRWTTKREQKSRLEATARKRASTPGAGLVGAGPSLVESPHLWCCNAIGGEPGG